MDITVIIPTRNPRRDYLDQVLQALRDQEYPIEKWELIVIDNASKNPLLGNIDVSWHPNYRCIQEEKPGLTPARIRGIREAKGKLIIFVDDDNVLTQTYLSTAERIRFERPYLGCWSGNVSPIFEETPPDELGPYLFCLCIRDVNKDLWSNTGDISTMPWGAGMCILKTMAMEYVTRIENSAIAGLLGRPDALPRGANDYDVAITCIYHGLGVGIFKDLVVQHLIPKERTTINNICKTLELGSASGLVFQALHGERKRENKGIVDKLVEKYKYLRASKTQKQINKAIQVGIKKGNRLLDDLKISYSNS
jgi:glycosyltransferase involved in cell wall biosynthesis